MMTEEEYIEHHKQIEKLYERVEAILPQPDGLPDTVSVWRDHYERGERDYPHLRVLELNTVFTTLIRLR